MENLPNKKSRIEELEKKLYAKDNKLGMSERHPLYQKDNDLNQSWQDLPNVQNKNSQEKIEKPKSVFGKILVVAFLFFIASVSYAGYVFWRGNQVVNADNVDIKILSPISIGGGEKLSLDLIIQNNNQIALETADLIIEYPVGTKNADDISKDIGRIREGLGDIPSGGIARKTIDAVLFGEENEKKKIIFTLEYRIPNSTAIFEKKKEFEIALNAAPIRLTVDGLREISSGQELILKYEIESNNIVDMENVLVRAEYPFGFNFISSNIEPKSENNLWRFATLNPKEKKTIEIRGIMEGQNEEERVFKFETGLARDDSPNEIQAVLSSYIHEVGIKKSFVDLNLDIGGLEREVSAREGVVTGNITFTNNTNDIINNIIISLLFDGSVINETTFVSSDGFYNSITNTLVFSAENNLQLSSINPRESRKLNFSFETFPITNSAKTFINPEVKISASVQGVRLSQNNVEENINLDTNKVVRIISDLNLSTGLLYNFGPISNSGPFPPKAETETTYVVELALKNSSNDLGNVEVTGKLPSYVSWKDEILPVGTNIVFDPGTRLFKWTIGSMKAGQGYTSDPAKVYFKIGLIPSQTQIGTGPTLVDDIKVSGNDLFAKTQINKTIGSIDTQVSEQGYGVEYKNVIK